MEGFHRQGQGKADYLVFLWGIGRVVDLKESHSVKA